MDMESDLGIDSIKKVEIFSSLKDSIPEMPSITASDMGQIRTLKEASEYIASRLNPEKKENSSVDNQENIEEEATPEENNIKRISLKLVDVDINKKVPFTGQLYIVSSHKSDMNVGIIESGFEKYNIEVLNGTFDEKIPDDVKGLIFAGNFSKDVNTDIQTKAFAILKDFLVAGGQFVASVSFLDGQFGLSNDILSDILESEKTSTLGVSPVFGGFAGLIKTALLEYPQIHAKAVDFDFHLINDVEKTSLIADVIMSIGAVEVGISVDGVKTIKLEETEQEKDVVFDKFEKDDVVLVFGGGRGVTYSCLYEFAKSLPEDKRPCWVIVGRTDIDVKEKSYTASLTEEKDIKRALMQNEGLAPALAGKEFKRIKAVREILSNIEKLKKFSSDVKYISADTSVEKSIIDVIDKSKKFGKIVGLIHGAGVLADKRIENKTNADFSRVLKTKANSAIFALKHLEDLKLLAFFSSSTARFGRIGQIDYSVGNEILNKIADFYKSTHKNTVVKSFNWGPWDGVMVYEGLKKFFE
jgi:NAD(P)-dependent dehydrogenase (short-subunit alcohol dehydrogenase family)